MIYTTCLMAYSSLSYSRSNYVQVLLGVFLVALSLFITLYYHYLQDPLFHQNVYAALTAFVILRSIYTMEMTLRPKWRNSTEADRLAKQQRGESVPTKQQQAYENQRDLEILKTMWIFVVFGLTVFLGGFGIWGLDNKYCSTIRRWRREMGLPWGIILEGHGWWHLMTGFGAYCYIIWGIWLRHILNGNQEEFRMVWPGWHRLPEVVRVKKVVSKDMNGSVANGDVKKRN